MAVGKKYSEELLVEYARRIAVEEGKDRGSAARWFMELTGASRGSAYRVREKLLSGSSIPELAEAKQRRKPRTNDIAAAKKKRDMFLIAAVKNLPGGKRRKISTERAIAMARSMGYLDGGYSRGTVDRFLKENGINAAHASARPMAHRLTADYPFHVIAVDATPIDHYYLRLDRTVAGRLDIPSGDKHLDDILRREELSKIWVYYMVDMYTKAFLVLPFASLPKGRDSKVSGESADDYYEFLKFCMLPKADMQSPLPDKPFPFRDCPVEGQPTILFCDRGSGIGGSGLIRNLCENLGIKIVTQKPGNPSSKGIVESRIGAFKRSYESLINPKLVKNINELTYFYMAWADYHNRKSGAYERWDAGVLDMPIVRLSEQSFRDASVNRIERTIDAYGCVQIDNKKFFVTPDESWKGAKVQVYRSYSREEGGLRYAARLGKEIVTLIAGLPEHGFEDIKSFPESQGSKNRRAVEELSGALRRVQIMDDILPPKDESNVIRLPNRNVISKETSSPIVPDVFTSTDSAIGWILNQNGIMAEDVPSKTARLIRETFDLLLDEEGGVSGEVVLNFSNIIAKYKREEEQCRK